MNDVRSVQPASRLLNLNEVLGMVGIGRTLLYKLVREEGFPPPVRMSDKLSRWREDDIADWIRERPPAERKWPAQLAASHDRRHRRRSQ